MADNKPVTAQSDGELQIHYWNLTRCEPESLARDEAIRETLQVLASRGWEVDEYDGHGPLWTGHDHDPRTRK